MNLVLVLFLFFICLMLTLGIPSCMGWKWVPKVITDVYLYGKNTEGRQLHKLVQLILIPKSWFSHFYAFAIVYMMLVLTTLVLEFVWNVTPPIFLTSYIELVASYSHQPLTSPGVSLLASVLFFFHVVRRFYETIAVSVFSNAKMNLVHYVSGILHYWGCCTVLLAYAANFSRFQKTTDDNFDGITKIYSGIHLQQVVGTAFFLLASYQQYVAHATLANLRKESNKKCQYVLPQGGLFKFVACPNFMCEIVLYISLYVILGIHHYPWALITCWVVMNQVLAAVMAKRWYKSKFETFPVGKKAIIPFII